MSTSRILVVEDEALVAADLEQRLQNLGYQVAAVVDTGEDAIALARQPGLDLALMDIRLRGEMSGIDAAQILRLSHHIPVVYLTSHADADTLARAGRTEPFGYIVKPFEEHDLHATIEMAFYRSRAEDRLRKIERWLKVTLDSIADGVIATDLAGRVTLVNRVAENLTGWSSAEALGRELGEVFDVRAGTDASSTAPLVAAIIDRGAIQHMPDRMTLMARDGRELQIEDSAAPIRDATGIVLGVVIVFRDRTEQERLLAERRRIEQKLQDSQRLESLGVLAGGIAHDFNNLLTGIVANTSLAIDLTPSPPEVREHLAEVQLASQRATELVRQMLAYSGRGQFVIEPVDLSALVRETTRLIQMSISKKADLRFDLAAELPKVTADAAQLRQVVMNLVINAAESLPQGIGSIDVSTRRVWADRRRLDGALGAPDLPEGTYIQLEVRDTGHGISPENLQRIFDPFFTTKFTGRGLGLAAVIGIVRAHKGALVVESEVGKGTTFGVLLPPTAEILQSCAVGQAVPKAMQAGGNALVIDDEPFVRSATSRLLTALGFAVDVASDGPEALDLLARTPKRFRLVMLDLTMPRMDGLEVFTAIRRLAPDARIVLMSGYGEAEATETFADRGLAAFLQKPFDTEDLLAALTKALG